MSDVNVKFNYSAARAARDEKTLESWLSGISDRYPGQVKTNIQIQHEEKGIFSLEPEIAGLGVPPQSLADGELDGLTRSEDSSTAFLRQQMMGKKDKARRATPVVRSAINLQGVEPGFQSSKGKSNIAESTEIPPNGLQPPKHETVGTNSGDEEDEIGRSGLGKRKRKSNNKTPDDPKASGAETKDVSVPAFEAEKNANPEQDVADESEENLDTTKLSRSAASKLGNKSKSKSTPRARSYLDEILAKQEAKQQRKKNKKKGG